MKNILLTIVLLMGPVWPLFTSVRDRNVAVATGTRAYAQGDATLAALAFAEALDAKSRHAPDPRLVLNLAHAQVRAGQPEEAQVTYGRLLTGSPAALGSVARQQLAVLLAEQGNSAQALSQLRQALLLDPQNAAARFNYEVLSDYLARRPNRPRMPELPKAPAPNQPKPAPDKTEPGPANQSQPAEKGGTDHKGEVNDPKPSPAAPTTPPQPQPNPTGTPDNRRPGATSGNAAGGGRQPGAGPAQPVASGTEPGSQRGLDRGSDAATSGRRGRSNAAGTEAATPEDVQLQTQRERLQAMRLSPAQARQLLETLRAQEQQYLQQVTRPTTAKPDPNKPSW